MVGVTHAELPSAALGMDRQLAARPGGWRGARRPDAGALGAHQHPGVYNACASTTALSAPLATPAGRMRPVLAACVALSLVLGPGTGDGCEDPPSPSFSRSIPAPQLSAEELHSPHMPQSLRCDACYAIAFQLEEQLSKAEAKLGRKALRESDYVEVLERSCSQSWELYGVQELNGEKRLTGPGLQSQQPLSVAMTGGPWPSRLAKMCHSFVGEQGEEQLYGAHRRGPSALRELLCHGEKGPCAPPAGGKAGRPAPPKAQQNEL